MIWLAVSVLCVCLTTLVLAWKSAHYVRRALSLFERPKPTWVITGWQQVVKDAPVTIVDRLVPLAERYLALRERQFEEASKPAPKPEEVPMLPPDLQRIADQESEEWAKESAAKALQELGIKMGGDWAKVRSVVMTDPMGNG